MSSLTARSGSLLAADKSPQRRKIIDEEAKQRDFLQKTARRRRHRQNGVAGAKKPCCAQTKADFAAARKAISRKHGTCNYPFSPDISRAMRRPGRISTCQSMTLPAKRLPVSVAVTTGRPTAGCARGRSQPACRQRRDRRRHRQPPAANYALTAPISATSPPTLGENVHARHRLLESRRRRCQRRRFSMAGTLAASNRARAAEAEYDVAAAAQYRKTVLAAFQDVADTLHALQSDATALKAQHAAERAAANSLKLSHQQFEAGSIKLSQSSGCRTDRTTGAAGPGSGRSAKICRYRCVVSGAGRRLVEPQAEDGSQEPDQAQRIAGNSRAGCDSASDMDETTPHSIQGWRARMKKRMIIMLIVVAVVAGGDFRPSRPLSGHHDQAIDRPQAAPQTISTIKAVYQDWQPELEAVGSLRAVNGAICRPKSPALSINCRLIPAPMSRKTRCLFSYAPMTTSPNCMRSTPPPNSPTSLISAT